MSAIPEPVKAQSSAVTSEETGTLIEGNAHHIVIRKESLILRSFTGRRGIAIIDPMMAPVIEEANGTRGLLIMILHCQRRHATCNALVAVDQRRTCRSGIRGIEMGHVHVTPHIPVVSHLIAQFGISTVLLESHVRSMAVRAVV